MSSPYDGLTAIATACGDYIGITDHAECALIALDAVGIKGERATRLAAHAAAEKAALDNERSYGHWRTARDYISADDAKRKYEREQVIRRLREIAQCVEIAA